MALGGADSKGEHGHIILGIGLCGGHAQRLTDVEGLNLAALHVLPNTDRGISSSRDQVLVRSSRQDPDSCDEAIFR